MAETLKTQVVVIGAGPGGYAAAFHAADMGLKTVLVNAEADPGGVCLLRGCIPSKALLHMAKVIGEARHAAACGVEFGEPKIDIDKLRAWKDGVIKKLSGGVKQLAGLRKVQYIHARARFLDAHTLELKPGDGAQGVPERIEFEHAILATGSRPTVPAAFQIDSDRVMSSNGALELPDVPGRFLVVGGGYIGLEMGTVYAALGSKVTVVELTDGLLPGVDRDLVRPLQAQLQKKFEAICLNTKVTDLTPVETGVKVALEGEGVAPEMTFDRVLVSIGRRPNNENLGLENTRVQLTERGFVKADASRRTDEPSIYAIGDIAGEPMLAHKAHREAKVAAEAIAGKSVTFDSIAIPAVVFTDPEVAWAGMMENEAKTKGIDYAVAKFPWGASGRALTLDAPMGVTKLVIDKSTERVLGVGIVGVDAGDLISEAVLAIEMGAAARDIADSIHPHPTLSETIMEAADVFYGEATHVTRAKK
ncbi:dihydrolipoyl dehydrogenase [bacterium]|nr:dihydrolipoyl dehydrogenase [bacterium]